MSDKLERERGIIPEASDKLVRSFKRVVDVAMQRVREGSIDSLNRQTVRLFDDKNSREYKVVDCSVGQLGEEIISEGQVVSGLFIDELQFDRKEGEYKLILAIQLPRNTGLVNKESLSSLIGFKLKEVNRLAFALSSARKV